MYCRKCGQELKTGAKFCTKCGTPAAEMPSGQAPSVKQNQPEIGRASCRERV